MSIYMCSDPLLFKYFIQLVHSKYDFYPICQLNVNIEGEQ